MQVAGSKRKPEKAVSCQLRAMSDKLKFKLLSPALVNC